MSKRDKVDRRIRVAVVLSPRVLRRSREEVDAAIRVALAGCEKRVVASFRKRYGFRPRPPRAVCHSRWEYSHYAMNITCAAVITYQPRQSRLGR